MTLPELYDDDAEDAERLPEISKRSRGVAVALGFLGGVFGLHRFYVGKFKTGLLMIVTIGGFGLWWLYDMVLLAAGEFRDARDLPLRRWGVDDPPRGADRSDRPDRRVEAVEDQIDSLRVQFDDLAERVDFAERMLAQQRESAPSRPQLPRG